MNTKSIAAATLGAVVILGTSGCGLGSASESAKHDSKTFEPPGKALFIEAPNDDIKVRTSGKSIAVDRWVKGDAKPTWKLTGNTLRLETECGLMAGDCGARYEIAVPKSLRVKVVTSNGDLSGTAMAPGFEVEATNGDVDLIDPQGPATIRTQNGDINAELDRAGAPYRLTLATTNGDKNSSIKSDPNSAKQIRLKTTNGDITVK